MFSNNFFTVSGFARLMGLSRQTLIYYDRIGLFKPAKIQDNRYRLYSHSQINVISMISMLAEMGVPLKEIRTVVDHLSPDTAMEILGNQRREAEEKLRRLRLLENMISLRMEQIDAGRRLPAGEPLPFSVTDIGEDIPLYVGEPMNCSFDEVAEDFIIGFYAECEKRGFPLIFTSGQKKRGEDILAGRTGIVSNMCFTLKTPEGANAVIPKGKYAVGYVRGDFGDTGEVYGAMLAFIGERGLKVAGDAYEEYLLDELAESNPENFVMKILLRVDACDAAETS